MYVQNKRLEKQPFGNKALNQWKSGTNFQQNSKDRKIFEKILQEKNTKHNINAIN